MVERTPFILALGSNVGDRLEHLRGGVAFLGELLEIEAVSRVVESEPWGPVAQGPFLNLTLRGSTDMDAPEVLRIGQAAEQSEGRRNPVRWGPRTLDVDLVFFGTLRVRSSTLEVPHPRWAERSFVYALVPEVAGEMIDPRSGRLLRDIVADPFPAGLAVSMGLDVPAIQSRSGARGWRKALRGTR